MMVTTTRNRWNRWSIQQQQPILLVVITTTILLLLLASSGSGSSSNNDEDNQVDVGIESPEAVAAAEPNSYDGYDDDLVTNNNINNPHQHPHHHHGNNNDNDHKTHQQQQHSNNNNNNAPQQKKEEQRHPRDELHYQHHQHSPPELQQPPPRKIPNSNDEEEQQQQQTTYHVNNDNEHHKQLYAKHHQHHQQPSTTSRVLELSDRFLEIVNNVLPLSSNGVLGSKEGDEATAGDDDGTATTTSTSTQAQYSPWLVMFYAPWCGHCKRLEPIFNHVAQALHNTPIRVGRVDCTRFPAVGSEYKILGYPTIMFISGPTSRHTFHGDRELTEIVRFANRMSAPPVTLSPIPLRKFLERHKEQHHNHTARSQQQHHHSNNNNNNNSGGSSSGENPGRVKRSEQNQQHHSNSNHNTIPELFFGLVKPSVGYRDKVTDAFRTVARKYQQHNEFYEFIGDDQDGGNRGDVLIFVVKSGRIVMFDYHHHDYFQQQQQHQRGGKVVSVVPNSNNNNVTNVLEHWVGNERFPDFIHLTRGNLHQVFSEGGSGSSDGNSKINNANYFKDLIVCAVVEEDRLERVVRGEERRLLGVVKGVGEAAIRRSLLARKSQEEEQEAQVPSSSNHNNNNPLLPYPTTPQTLPEIYSWIGSPDLANSIVAQTLPLPTLLIIQRSPTDRSALKYYTFSNLDAMDSESEVENIIELVKEGHFTPDVHANSLGFRVYRYAFDAKVGLVDMWVGNPVLTIVLFGLPLGFFSLILYSACCGDIMDAKEEEDDELDYDDDDDGGGGGGGGRSGSSSGEGDDDSYDDEFYDDDGGGGGGGGGQRRRRMKRRKHRAGGGGGGGGEAGGSASTRKRNHEKRE